MWKPQNKQMLGRGSYHFGNYADTVKVFDAALPRWIVRIGYEQSRGQWWVQFVEELK